MIGFLTFMKALFLFIKEIYSNDDELAPKDRKQKIILFVFLVVTISLGYIGTIYLDHAKTVSASKIEILNARLSVAEKSKGELEYRLMQERNYGDRIELVLERSNQEVKSLEDENESLRETITSLQSEIRELEEATECTESEGFDLYERLMELHAMGVK